MSMKLGDSSKLEIAYATSIDDNCYDSFVYLIND